MQALQSKRTCDEMPIGIFDSGVGGLTVMKEIMNELPDESILYLGDTARVPYGTRSPETVIRYSYESAQFLMSKGIKLLVVACNTSSSVSLELLRERFHMPVVGVIEPGARAAAASTRAKRIAIIGTETTINSGSYEQAIRAIDKSIKVTGIACPLFVPLVEEGWFDGEVATLVAEKYLHKLKYDGFDTLVLGCTHYPMIKNVIANVVRATLIDSAVETAKEVRHILERDKMLRKKRRKPYREFFVTDAPEKFKSTGKKFLRQAVLNVSKVRLGG